MSSTAIVTGAARGIGLAIMTRLARDGFAVVGIDRDGAAVKAAAEALRDEGLQAQGVELDVTDRAGIRAVMEGLTDLAVVVNNAGIASQLVGFRDLSEAALRQMISVNVYAPFMIAQEAARRMGPGGRIINIASRGYLGGAGACHYVASKAAVVGMTRAMAVEMRWDGMTVNAIAPGMVQTRMIEDFTVEQKAALLRREPTGAPADPDVIAGFVSFVASPAAAFMNGQVLLADGGKSVGMPPL